MTTEGIALNQARQFHLAGERCLEQRPVALHTVNWLPIAASVNLALACELYMKAILLGGGTKVPRTHDLKALSEKLPEPVLDHLRDVYKPVDGESIDQVLATVANTFQSVRYFYEAREQSQTLFDSRQVSLAEALEMACVKYLSGATA
ncbi:MAG: hypothetical protein WC184_04340 [Acidimicrobiia bacterium]